MSALAHTSTRQRLWLVGGAFVALLLMLIGYFALIGPQRSETDAVNSRVDATRTRNSLLASRITALQVQNRQLSTYRAQARAAMAALPATSGVPAFLRSLQTLGSQTHTDAVSVTVGAPLDVTTVANGTAATPATAGASAAPAATSAPTTPTGAAAATTPGVYSLPITAQVNGSAAALAQFLQQLQDVQPRAVLVTSITQGTGIGGTSGTVGASGATGASGTTLQLTMQAFVAPSLATTAQQLANS